MRKVHVKKIKARLISSFLLEFFMPV